MQNENISHSPGFFSSASKSRYCFICALNLRENLNKVDFGDTGEGNNVPEQEPESTLSQEEFVDGVSVLCHALNIENKFELCEEWNRLGTENVVKFICCEQCSVLLKRLVSLRALIRDTEVSIKQHVNKIEHCVVESMGRSNDVEYVLSSCIDFRDAVLRNYQLNNHDVADDPDISEVVPPSQDKHMPVSILKNLVPKARRSKPFLKKVSRDDKVETRKFQHSVRPCFVKLERADHMDEDETDNLASAETHSNESLLSSLFLGFEDENIYGKLVVNEKSGRRIRDESTSWLETISKPVKRKRGRPRKKVDALSLEHSSLADCNTDSRCLEGTEATQNSESIVHDSEEEEEVLNDFVDNDQTDDDYEPNISASSDSSEDERANSPALNSDEEFLPEARPKRCRTGRKRGRPRKVSAETLSNECSIDVIKKKRGRPRKVSDGTTPNKCFTNVIKKIRGRRPKYPEDHFKYSRNKADHPKKRRDLEDDELLQDGPNFKPIVVLDAENGIFMFMNVKIHKEPTMISCKHPGCNYFVSNVSCFSEQVAFRSMRFHVKNEHRRNGYKSVGSYYSCRDCGGDFSARQLLVEHIRSLHPDSETPQTLCEVCGDVMIHQNLIRHLLTHKSQEEKELALANKVKRKGRQADVTKPKVFPCDECEKVFKSHTELRLHKICHVPIELRKQFQCDLCPVKLSNHNSLKNHRIRVHFKETMPKPYVCPICARGYIRAEKTKFDLHVREHTGERPFQCATCGKDFRGQENLTRHERTHEERMIQCEFCPKWYRNKKGIRDHQIKHHPEFVTKPDTKITKKYLNFQYRPDFIGPKFAFPCEPCNKVYVYKSQLITHMKHKHKLFLEKSDDYPNQNNIEDEDSKSDVFRTPSY